MRILWLSKDLKKDGLRGNGNMLHGDKGNQLERQTTNNTNTMMFTLDQIDSQLKMATLYSINYSINKDPNLTSILQRYLYCRRNNDDDEDYCNKTFTK